MPKPLVSSTFLSFPKLLLWSVPLLLILGYTYLAGGLNGKISALISSVSVLHAAEDAVNEPIRMIHDSEFIPDFTLRVTEEQFTQSCLRKDDVILINGTTPGPEIRLVEGNVYWIRVFNDMKDHNLTMVVISQNANTMAS